MNRNTAAKALFFVSLGMGTSATIYLINLMAAKNIIGIILNSSMVAFALGAIAMGLLARKVN